MPRNGIGFGRDAFGSAPFGRAWWTRRVLWEDIPDFDKNLDATDGDGALEAFLRVIGDMLEDARTLADDMEFLRDPWNLRTKYNGAVSISGASYVVVGAEETDDEDGMAYVTVTVSDGRDLLPVTSEWTVDDGVVQYQIREIRKLDNEVDIYNDSAPAGSSLTFRPPPMLGHLGADLGVMVDGHEPEVNQRSSVGDYHKLLDLKGTEQGIVLRAAMAGFDATVYSLYRISGESWESTVGSDHIWEIPDGSGQWYTDVPPTSVLYDTVPADVIPTDIIGDCGSPDLEFTGTVVSATGSAGDWDTTFTGDLTHAISGYWYFTYDSDTSDDPTRYYTDGSSDGTGRLNIISETEPVAGAITWHYYCPIETTCDYCKSYKLRIELEISDAELLASPRALEAAFSRMQTKIEKMLPAHVKVVQYVFSTRHSASVEVSSSSLSQSLQYDLFDQVAADVQPTDQYTVTDH